MEGALGSLTSIVSDVVAASLSFLLHHLELLSDGPWTVAVTVGVALVGMSVLTPLVIRVARRVGWVAYPQEDRWHDRPVALMGGIAIFGAAALAAWATGGMDFFSWPVLLAAVLVFFAGLADDLFEIRPEAKLVAQILATILLLYAGLAFWRGGPFWVSVPLTFLWVIGITNAVNLIDGMDGLASGVAAIAATALGLIAWSIGLADLALLAFALAGAAAGFLFFNFQPARIFMGDCGSMFLGFTLATLAMSVQGKGGPFAATLVPIVVLAVPIFDTTFVTVTRILSGVPVTQGGTDHTMHRLVHLGLSERRTVLLMYGVSALFGLSTLAVYQSTAQLFYALVLLVLVASVTFGLYLASARPTDASAPQRLLSQRVGAVMRAVFGGVAWKSIVGMVADLLIVGAVFVAAHHLRFGATPPEAVYDVMLTALPAVIGVKIVVFYLGGLYHGIWRHAGTPELVRIVGASTLAAGATYAGLLLVFGADRIAPAVVILDWILATGAVAAVRFGFRGLRQYFAAQRDHGPNALLYGTGPHALLALRYLRQDGAHIQRTVVGLLTDDTGRVGHHVQGLSVMGSLGDLAAAYEDSDAEEVIIADGDVSASRRAAIEHRCREHGIPCQHFSFGLNAATLPSGEALPASLRNGASAGDGSSSGDGASAGDGTPREAPRLSSE